MKKLFVSLLCVAACLSGCQKDLVTLDIELEHYNGSDQKLHVENRFSCWDNGDTVIINQHEYTVSVSGNNATIAGVNNANNYYAAYPASMVQSATDNYLTLNLPTVQQYRTNALGDQVVDAIMAGTCGSEGPLKFHNIASLLKITFTSPTPTHVRKIVVKSTGESRVPLSGYGDLAIQSDNFINFTMRPLSDGCDSVVLDCGLGAEVNTSRDFYIVIPSGQTIAQLTIKVIDDFQTYTHSLSQSVDITRNNIYSLNFATNREGVTATPHTKPLCNQIFCYLDPNERYPYSLTKEFPNAVTQVFNGKTIITAPYALTNLPAEAFGDRNQYGGNHALIRVTLPEGMTSIGDYAFYNCWKLATIDLPSTLTAIGEYAFRGCSRLNNIAALPAGLTSIGRNAFDMCESMYSIQIPNTITRIEDATFASTSLISIELPSSITYIGKAAFNACTHLNSVILNEGLQEIDEGAFGVGDGFSDHCLSSIVIPSTVTHIGNGALNGCKDLRTVTMRCTTAPSIGTTIFPSSLDTIYIPQNATGYDQGGWEVYQSVIRER